jgi:peroxiredoxin
VKIIFVSVVLAFFGLLAKASVPKTFSGESLINSSPLHLDLASIHEGLVVVFMSAKCPCSNSHVAILKKLSQKYQNFKFIGIHSNSDESKESAQKYFKSAGLRFDIIQDQKNRLANELQAYKTPHAFVISPSGEILY